MTQELANNIKRLRDIYACHNGADPHELMYVVNQLVELVAEMRTVLHPFEAGRVSMYDEKRDMILLKRPEWEDIVRQTAKADALLEGLK